ncbi:3-oxoacyl-[acyl-carrier protein] reductase [Geminocystis sp. NIES-3708]|uniref:SDR family NAD(P)-dependent oxidoreductase n=1 Tax=Geminocystis sp. NIES-3708 TaxID=1615909 RepID=UPI0005FC86AC|nr:glucose 1-dehydrogenase [Geminocystis sp. NIES-3708]BAQ61748.1 3-oxoacyl-[acyl-carrier protein] reductase [Geminocystis sp. NIES-3708]
MKLENKVAIVTGGSKGIGKGVALVFCQEGAKVVIAANGVREGQEAVAEIKEKGGEAIFVKCDIANENEVQDLVNKTIDTYGRLDILVNNAGIGTYKSVLECTSEEWDRCLAVNLKGFFLCSKYSIPHMQSIGKGVIINMSSVHSHASAKGTAPYCASKGAITSLTRNMALDYGPVIRVNSIAPGWVLTPLIEDLFNSYDDPAAARKKIEDRQVMKRIGTPEDVGYACAFLASDEASFITGTQLFVDGGLTAVLEDWE